MLTTLFVVTRIVANPISNVFQKQLAQRGANPIFIIAATHAILTLVAIPILIFSGSGWGEFRPGFWMNISICTILAVTGNALLVYALRASDLSVLGPVNAYKPVLSLGLAIFLLGEVPTAFGAVGVALVLAGSYFVVDPPSGKSCGNFFQRFFRDRGIQLRLGALVFSATEAVFLKRAILLSSPMTTFLLWSVLGFPVAACAVACLPRGSGRHEVQRFGQHVPTFLWLALTTGLMQATTLFTFGRLQVGYSLALFQLSTLLSVFLGYRYFAERNIRRRLVGAFIMVAGAMLIVASGRVSDRKEADKLPRASAEIGLRWVVR